MIKVDRQKVLALAFDIQEAIGRHCEKTGMNTAEIQLALTQAIYNVGRVAATMEREKALRAKA